MRSKTRPASLAGTFTAGVLALALIAAGCGGNHHHDVPPPSSTTSPTSVPVTGTALPATGPYDWVRDASPTLVVGGGATSTLTAVLPPAGAAPWIVAGTRGAADGSTTATVWTSTNAISWRSTPLTGPQVDSHAAAATTWHTDTVLVGSLGDANNQRAAVWVSPSPGAPFAQVPGVDLPAPVGGSAMTAVTGGDLGLFVSGTANGHVAMWYSSNGQKWTELSGAERVIAGADDAHVDTLLAAPSGVYAAGWDRVGTSIDAALWSSGDGVNWSPVVSAQNPFAGGGDHVITGLAPLGTGLVAVGGSQTGATWSPTSWISPNGTSWSEPSTTFAMGARPQSGASTAIVQALSSSTTFTTATSASSSLVAVGGGLSAQRIWTSTSGVDWKELALPPAAAASDRWRASLVAVSGSTTVIADSAMGQPHFLVRQAGAWKEPSADPANFGPVQTTARAAGLVSASSGMVLAVDLDHQGQVLGPGSSSVELLTSKDASTWSPIAGATPFAASEIDGIGTIPAASATTHRPASTTTTTPRRPATSTSARTTASETIPATTGHAPARASVVAVGARSTSDGPRAAAWISSNGTLWYQGGPLDAAPTAVADQANGVCATSSTTVAVGNSVSPSGGTGTRAWYSTDGGVRWRLATFSTPTNPDSADAIEGCVATATGFAAYGTATTTTGTTEAAYWTSTKGAQWSRVATSPFGSGFPFPAMNVAAAGSTMLASGGTDAVPAWVFAGGRSETADLWQSTNGGTSWQSLDTMLASGQDSEPAQISRVAFLHTAPLVAGEVGGQLAVWTGVPTS